MRAALIAAALSIAGCTTAHVEAESTFTPVSDREFVFTTQAYLAMSENVPQAEEMRRQVIARRVAAGGFCPRGYDIVERRAALDADGLLGKAHTIYYRGRCKG